MSSLQVTTKLLHIKSSKFVFDDICAMFKKWLPNDNNLPGSYDAAKKLMKSLGFKFMKIHACRND